MPKKEEKVTVAKSTIIFKTKTPWFVTLVSGLVETFFPDRKMTFGIDFSSLSFHGGECDTEDNQILIDWRQKYDGIRLAGVIVHEIIHIVVKGGHTVAFEKEARKAGLIMAHWNGYTVPSQEFGEKVIPILEKSGFLENHCLIEDKDKTNEDNVCFVKNDNGKWSGSYSHYNKDAIEKVCRRLEFLDKNVFRFMKGKIDPFYLRFSFFTSYRLENTDFTGLFQSLNDLYFQQKSSKEEARRIFEQLIKDKSDELNDEKLEFVSVLEKRPVGEFLSLSRQANDFLLLPQIQTNLSMVPIDQIRTLCRFLTECLFPSKQPVKSDVLLRINHPKESVEEYCSYLSKKLAELFGADPAGVRESEYLPFLDDFGDLFVAKEKRFFPYLVYKRPVYRYVRFRRTSAAYSNLNRADLASLVAHVNHQLKGGHYV